MKQVNERSTATLVLTFSNEYKILVTPTSAKYQIIDEDTGTVLTFWTALTVITTSYALTIGQDNNRIINRDNESENRIVTVVFEYGSPVKQCTSEFKYEVKKLNGIPVGVVLDVSGGLIVGGNVLLANT